MNRMLKRSPQYEEPKVKKICEWTFVNEDGYLLLKREDGTERPSSYTEILSWRLFGNIPTDYKGLGTGPRTPWESYG